MPHKWMLGGDPQPVDEVGFIGKVPSEKQKGHQGLPLTASVVAMWRCLRYPRFDPERDERERIGIGAFAPIPGPATAPPGS